MAKRSEQFGHCTADGWYVSVTSGDGKHVLNVHRRGEPTEVHPFGRMLPGELDGREFPSSDAAFAAARERGYIRPWERVRNDRRKAQFRPGGPMVMAVNTTARGVHFTLPVESVHAYRKPHMRFYQGRQLVG